MAARPLNMGVTLTPLVTKASRSLRPIQPLPESTRAFDRSETRAGTSYIIYTPSGHMMVHLMNKEGRTKYAGAQPTYEGLDQVNFQIPPSLAGQGTVSLALTVDNASSNSLTLTFK